MRKGIENRDVAQFIVVMGAQYHHETLPGSYRGAVVILVNLRYISFYAKILYSR
jgi:hypothetical protein